TADGCRHSPTGPPPKGGGKAREAAPTWHSPPSHAIQLVKRLAKRVTARTVRPVFMSVQSSRTTVHAMLFMALGIFGFGVLDGITKRLTEDYGTWQIIF